MSWNFFLNGSSKFSAIFCLNFLWKTLQFSIKQGFRLQWKDKKCKKRWTWTYHINDLAYSQSQFYINRIFVMQNRTNLRFVAIEQMIKKLNFMFTWQANCKNQIKYGLVKSIHRLKRHIDTAIDMSAEVRSCMQDKESSI